MLSIASLPTNIDFGIPITDPMFRRIFITTSWLLLLFVLVYTAFAKLLNFNHYKRSMYSQPLAEWLVDWLIFLIPFTELIAATLLILSVKRFLGLVLTSSLMLLFTGYVLFIRFTAWEDTTCPCGGLFSQLNWVQHTWVNSALTILAITTTILYTKTFPGHGKWRNADASTKPSRQNQN